MSVGGGKPSRIEDGRHLRCLVSQVSIYSFHTGRPLNLWERCSLQSFADYGHDVTLFSYRPLEVPPGVKLRDASVIISELERNEFFANAPGNFAQFSDLFRYELLAELGGWWVDTDVLCLSETLPSTAPWVATRNERSVNTAVLYFPQGHPLMRMAADEARTRLDPRVRSPIGPSFLFSLLQREQLPIEIQAREACYPIIGRAIFDIGEPSRKNEVIERVKDSCALHWWSQRIYTSGCRREALPPSGSWLAIRFKQHGGANAEHYSPESWRKFIETHDRVKREANQRQKTTILQRLKKQLAH